MRSSRWAAATPAPIYPGKRYLDWELADPAGQDLEAVRTIRDDIDARVQALLVELVPTRAKNLYIGYLSWPAVPAPGRDQRMVTAVEREPTD